MAKSLKFYGNLFIKPKYKSKKYKFNKLLTVDLYLLNIIIIIIIINIL